jgi:hypothetical protein
LRESGRDFVALQALMGHSRPDTTQHYTDEVELDELTDALGRAADARHAQAQPEVTTLEPDVTAAPGNAGVGGAGIEPATSCL